jgi:trigger factor
VKVTKEILENKKVKLEIHVDPETFEKGMEKSYLKNRKGISVPGFRKGRVPRKIIERYYGEAIFYEDAINDIFPEVYEAAIKETEIEPVDRPELDIIQIGSGQDLILTAEVDVKPEVKLGQYKGIEVEKAEYTVSDDEVEHQLEHILEDNARWVEVEDRAVENGDLVSLDYAGSVDGEAFPGGTAENYSLEIGSGHFIPGFEEQLVGMSIGEEKDITVTFPEEYHAEDLKGKEAVFHVKIHEIKEKELPELDDEFAKDISEFETLDEYKADLKQKLQKSADDNARTAMENQLIQKICDNAEVDIPQVMVENEVDNLVREMEFNLQYSGLNLERYLEMTNTSIEDFRAQFNDRAYNRVKTQLVLESVTKAENISVTEDDLEEEYARMAEQYGRDIEEIKKNFSTNVQYIEDTILAKKTVDMLMAEAVFVEKQETEENKEHQHDHDHDHDHHDHQHDDSEEPVSEE